MLCTRHEEIEDKYLPHAEWNIVTAMQSRKQQRGKYIIHISQSTDLSIKFKGTVAFDMYLHGRIPDRCWWMQNLDFAVVGNSEEGIVVAPYGLVGNFEEWIAVVP